MRDAAEGRAGAGIAPAWPERPLAAHGCAWVIGGAAARGRLLTRQRSGRAVLYQPSELGLALLTASAASDRRR